MEEKYVKDAMEISQKISEIKEQIIKYHSQLSISRIPSDTVTKFKKIASKEFCNDYGLCLKHLVDNHEINKKLDFLIEEVKRK